MIQVWWTTPAADGRRAVTDRLLSEAHPLYLPAGLPLLRQTLSDLSRAGQRRPDALVFARFLERTFADAYRDWRTISSMEQRTILGQLLETVSLPELAPILHKPGLVRSAERLIRELKAAGIARAAWPALLTHGKEPAFARLAQAYQSFLEAGRLADREDVFRMAAEALASHGPKERHSLVVIEGFATLNRLERNAIAALGMHLPVLLAVTYDPSRPELFAPTVQSLGEWWSDHEPASAAGPVQRPAALAALQDGAFAGTQPGQAVADASVQLIEAPDPSREVGQVARIIKEMLLAGQYRADQIGIVSARPEQDRELVRRTMGRYGIPVSLPPEPMITAPVVQALLELLRAGAAAYQSPYLPDPEAAPAFLPLPDRGTVAAHCAVVARNLEGLHVEESIIALMHRTAGGDPARLDGEAAALGARELSAYRGFLRTLTRLERAHRQLETPLAMEPDQFLALLSEALTEATYHGQPRLPGPAVRFVVPAQLEGLRVPVLFVLGLSEGSFPAAAAEDWVLPDRRRQALAAAAAPLETREHRRAVDRLQFMRVVRAASDRLWLCRSAAGEDGAALVPSAFWDEALSCLGRTGPDLKLPAGAPAHLTQAYSEEELLQRLVQVVRAGSADAAEADLAEELLRHGVRGLSPEELAALERRIAAEDGRWSAEYGPWDGRLTDHDVVTRLADRLGGGGGGEYRYSASELESYAACPFRYLGERLLGIRSDDETEGDLDAKTVGASLHRILAEFYRTPGMDDLLSPAAEQRLAELVTAETTKVTADLGPALREAWHRQFHRQAMAWLAAERQIRQKAAASAPVAEQLNPTYLEWSFGQKARPGNDPHSTPEPLKVEAGGKAFQIQGVVDRIDCDQAGGFTVYDYKTGKSPSVGDIVQRRVRLQIPLYLLAARRLGLKGTETPVGGAYYGLRDRKRTGGLWRSSKKAVHGVTYHGCLQDDAAFEQTLESLEAHVVQLIDDLTGGNLTVNPRITCPAYCPVRAICRFDASRLEAKAGRADKEAASE